MCSNTFNVKNDEVFGVDSNGDNRCNDDVSDNIETNRYILPKLTYLIYPPHQIRKI